MSAVLDTNVSRHRHRSAIRYVSPFDGDTWTKRSGFVYECPRCEWRSRVMKHKQGAERHGDQHALVCLVAVRG